MVSGRFLLGLVADTRVGKTNTVVFGMILAGVLQLLLWAIPQGHLGAAFAFALLYGMFSGGYIGKFIYFKLYFFSLSMQSSCIGLFPLVLTVICPPEKLYAPLS